MAWTNWAGTVTAHPVATAVPRSPEEVADAVRDAGRRGLRVRMRGSGHSFTDVAATDGVMLDPSLLHGVVAVDRAAMTVTVLAGTPLHELNAQLDRLGLALHNMGDIDRQTVAGALSTGTHGTGGTTASLAGQVEALELVAGDGSLRTVSRAEDPDHFHAARVGLGAVGVLTTVTFRVEPAFTLQADERPMRWAEAVGRHDELVAEHHHVDLYWFPHTDRCTGEAQRPHRRRAGAAVAGPGLPRRRAALQHRLRPRRPALHRRTSGDAAGQPHHLARPVRAELPRRSHRVFVAPRRVVFREMEYSVPREVGMTALAEVRHAHRLVRVGRRLAGRGARHAARRGVAVHHPRAGVGLPRVPRRPPRGPPRLLRPGRGGSCATTTGGRTGASSHRRTAADLAPAYPHWDDFARVRDRVDPDRVFGNDYLDRVLG